MTATDTVQSATVCCPACGQSTDKMRIAPVQGYEPGIPWDMHLRAYNAYSKKYRPQPALIEGWCRGGFGVSELDDFIPGWREELSIRTALQSELSRAREREKELVERCAQIVMDIPTSHDRAHNPARSVALTEFKVKAAEKIRALAGGSQ